MAVTTSGWTRGPGFVPPEIARALVGSDNRLNHAAAIWDRPALWTHAKSTVVMARQFRNGERRRDRRIGRATARASETGAARGLPPQAARGRSQAHQPDEYQRTYPSGRGRR